MLAKQLKSSKEDSDSESDMDGPKWSKGLDTVQQMYIAQAYKGNNGYDSNSSVTSIGVDELKVLKKRTKTATRQLKRNWEAYTTLCVGPKRRKVPKELTIAQSYQRYVIELS